MPRGSVSPTPPRRLLRTWRVIVQDVMVTDLDGVTWQYPREGMLWAGSPAGRKTRGDAVGNQPCECTVLQVIDAWTRTCLPGMARRSLPREQSIVQATLPMLRPTGCSAPARRGRR